MFEKKNFLQWKSYCFFVKSHHHWRSNYLKTFFSGHFSVSVCVFLETNSFVPHFNSKIDRPHGQSVFFLTKKKTNWNWSIVAVFVSRLNNNVCLDLCVWIRFLLFHWWLWCKFVSFFLWLNDDGQKSNFKDFRLFSFYFIFPENFLSEIIDQTWWWWYGFCFWKNVPFWKSKLYMYKHRQKLMMIM